MTLPQLLFVVLATTNVAIHLAHHGKPLPVKPEYNYVGALWRAIAWAALLWWGGFFQ